MLRSVYGPCTQPELEITEFFFLLDFNCKIEAEVGNMVFQCEKTEIKTLEERLVVEQYNVHETKSTNFNFAKLYECEIRLYRKTAGC